MFLFSGRFKYMPELAWLPVDLTALCLAIGGGISLVVLVRRPAQLARLVDPGCQLFLLFLAYAVGSFLWSEYSAFSYAKALDTATLLAWSFLGAFLVIGPDPERRRRFVIGLVVLSVGLIAYWGVGRLNAPSAEFYGYDDARNTYLSYGFHAQFVALTLLAVAIAEPRRHRMVAALLGALGTVVLMLFIGARGPMLVVLVAPLLLTGLALLDPRGQPTRRRMVVIALIWVTLLGLGVAAARGLFAEQVAQMNEDLLTLGRMRNYYTIGIDDSLGARLEAQRQALMAWFEMPLFGHGLGSFGDIDERMLYPHNLAIELLMELGVVGLGLYVGVVVVALYRLRRSWGPNGADWVSTVIAVLLIGELVARSTAQGFLPHDRALFAFLGLAMAWLGPVPPRLVR